MGEDKPKVDRREGKPDRRKIKPDKLKKFFEWLVSVWKIILMSLLVVVTVLFLIRLPFKNEVIMSPFKNNTENQSSNIGRATTDSLSLEIDEIAEIHNQESMAKAFWSRSDNFNISSNLSRSNELEQLGTIGVGGVQIPAGKAFLAFKQALPISGKREIITGSIHEFKDTKTSLMRIVARKEGNDGNILNQWVAEKEGEGYSILSGLITELACKMSLDVHKLRSTSWESVRYLHQGVKKLNDFKRTNDVKDFCEAEINFLNAIGRKKKNKGVCENLKEEDCDKTENSEDGSYKRFGYAHYYLGVLYSWADKYRLNEDCYKDRCFLAKAKEALKSPESRRRSNNLKALSHYGLGVIGFREYREAKKEYKQAEDEYKEAKDEYKEAMKDKVKKRGDAVKKYAEYIEGHFREAIEQDKQFREATEQDKQFLAPVIGLAFLFHPYNMGKEKLKKSENAEEMDEEELKKPENAEEMDEEELKKSENAKKKLEKALKMWKKAKDIAEKNEEQNEGRLKWIEKKIEELDPSIWSGLKKYYSEF